MNLFTTQLSEGPGRPVVVSHALGLDHTMWSEWAATQAGLRPVLAYDLRGQGRSPMSDGPLTLQAHVDDAEQLIEQWQVGPVVWLGLSMGGMVGQGLAIRRPDLVRGVVLAHTAAAYPLAARSAWSERIRAVAAGGMAAVADMVTQRYLNEAFRMAQPTATSQLRTQLLNNNPEGYIANCQAVAAVDWLDALHLIACPTLVIAGALDLGATPAMAREIHQRISGAQLEIFKNASHLSPLEQPQLFHQAIQTFLNGLDTR